MYNFMTGETPSFQETGTNIDTVAKLARLGLVLDGTTVTYADGRAAPEAFYRFIADSPLGRANVECGLDVDILDGLIGDAESLSYDEFAVRFPKFGPYDS